MTSKIIITKLQTVLANGDVAGAKASITTFKGKNFEWTGKLSDGSAYLGGQLEEGDYVIASNSTGLFAWTVLNDTPPLVKVPPVKKKPAEKTPEAGSVRQARQARAANKP